MQYRLHIDIPLGHDEEKAAELTKQLMNEGFKVPSEVKTINYRLGHDEDRQKSNYLIKNENGHVSNKKTRIEISG